MTASQVAANYSLGPWPSPGSQSINFTAISNVTLNAGVTLNVTNSATDSNQPPLPLTFSILSAPAGATINASSGLFTWRPVVAQANTTNLITLKVQNAATPGLSATQSFTAKINAVTTPAVTSLQLTNGVFGFQISGGVGPDYLIQASTNLFDWFLVYSNNPASLPFSWADTNAFTNPARFYRVQLGP